MEQWNDVMLSENLHADPEYAACQTSSSDGPIACTWWQRISKLSQKSNSQLPFHSKV